MKAQSVIPSENKQFYNLIPGSQNEEATSRNEFHTHN